MRALFITALLPALVACASQSGYPDEQCREPRPQVCTMEYDPSCGVMVDGSHKDYSSPCNACADDQVVSVSRGACPE